MFLKRHFKPLLELKIFQANVDLNNINNIIIQNQYGIWSYQVNFKKIIYQKVFYIEENPSNNLSISFNLCEFLLAISQIHGSQQSFNILDTGEIVIYRKKDNILLNTIKLSSIKVQSFMFENRDFLDSIKNKKNLIKLCQACKRFSNELDYYTGFNRIALFVDNDLRFFSTDGLHSLEFLLSESIQNNSKNKSFYLGDDFQQSQDYIKILENFLTFSSNEKLEVEISQTSLSIQNNNEKIVLPLSKNNEFNSSQDIYDEKSNDYSLLTSKNIKSILEVLSKKSISQYRKKNNIKEPYKTTCEITDNFFNFNNEKIEIFKTNKGFSKIICVYHLVEFLNSEEEYKLYNDRLEGIMSILYF